MDILIPTDQILLAKPYQHKDNKIKIMIKKYIGNDKIV
jgi:hypothetical protein